MGKVVDLVRYRAEVDRPASQSEEFQNLASHMKGSRGVKKRPSVPIFRTARDLGFGLLALAFGLVSAVLFIVGDALDFLGSKIDEKRGQ